MDQQPARAVSPSALIINDGTLGGLVASWAEGIVCPTARRPKPRFSRETDPPAEPAAPLLWFPHDDKPARDRRREAAAAQTDLCALSGFSDRQLIRFEPPAPPHAHLAEGIAYAAKTNAMLLAAAVEAAALGIPRIIWPIHVGAAHGVEIDALADVCDRALLIGQLMGLGTGGGGVCCSHERRAARDGADLTIETPYADFTDARLMDLALDMDVPLHACWWCLNEDPRPCGHCAACMRWREALAAVDPANRLDIGTLTGAPPAPSGVIA